VTGDNRVVANGNDQVRWLDVSTAELKSAWLKPLAWD
jgi:hypothetical protein